MPRLYHRKHNRISPDGILVRDNTEGKSMDVPEPRFLQFTVLSDKEEGDGATQQLPDAVT